MTTIYLTAADQRLSVAYLPTLAAHDKESVKIHVDADAHWTGYVLSAVFSVAKKSSEIYEMILTDGECTVPSEVLAEQGILLIGVRGVEASTGAIKTSSLAKCRIVEGAEAGNANVSEPTPDLYAQLLHRMYGVYIGSEEPTDSNIMAWIDPDGTPTGGGSSLPSVTTADNGKVLQVVNGAWVAAEVEIGTTLASAEGVEF